MSLGSITEVRDKGIPNIPKDSIAYEQFWREEMIKIREGFNIGNTYISGRLYFYLNYWKIAIKKANSRGSKREVQGSPEFRDIDWEFFNKLEQADIQHKGLCVLTGRGKGKTYWCSSVAAHNFIFYPKGQTLLTAGESQDLNTICSKTRLGMSSLPKELQVQYRGTWDEMIISSYKKKTDEGIVEAGSQSILWIRNFKNNPMAANGTRPKIHIFEEAGKHIDLIDCYNASSFCWDDGAEQFGIPIIVGTGGDMEKGTYDFSQMFYDATTYNLLPCDLDIPEETGTKVGFFIPCTKGDMQFNKPCKFGDFVKHSDKKDKTLIYISDIEKAREHYEGQREIKAKARDKSALYQLKQYQPFCPSEAFLITKGSIFNKTKIAEQMSIVRNNPIEQRGDLIYNDKGELSWQPEIGGDFQIIEHPDSTLQSGTYIAGTDPYQIDKTITSVSLGSTFIYKRFIGNSNIHHCIPVAQFTARPETQAEYFDGVIKLLEYYGAKCLFENNIPRMYEYFLTKKKSHLLLPSPVFVTKSIVAKSRAIQKYGITMSAPIKDALEIAIRDYIEQYCGNIYFMDLLEEMARYTPEKNFDRVIAFGLCLFHEQEQSHKMKHDDDSRGKIRFKVYNRQLQKWI